MKVPVSLGIGASFDFEAGTIRRAPIWMQKSGLEWFWRFCQEPKRMFKRYFIDDSQFFLLLLKEKYIRKAEL
nr:WecB/TagA/CpsF family glycosyltransferase [Planococcus glaciei]